ncbi:MAG: ComEC/Rec2 family competence protein [Clostridiales bacterium]|nr:ComEC/Rec2 family competence protein [Clostridiales bacterium]
MWLGTLPVTLWFFYQTSPWSIIVNLAVIPLMSSLMASALISCFAGLISIPAGMFLSAPVYYLLGLFEWLCHLEQKLPCAVWIAGRPAVWKLVAYYALLAGAALLSWKPRRKKTITPGTRTEEYAGEVFRISNAFVWIAAITIGIGLMVYHPCAALTVTCMDVGQGDGALLQMPDGVNCLIDGGSTSVSGLWEYRISQTVRYYGISTIDYVFLSHADSDHISGILEYLEDYLPGFGGKNAHGITVKHLVIPPTADETDFEELIEKANTLGISVLRMEAGAALGNIQGNTDTRNNAGRMSLGYFGKNASLWSLTCLAPSSSNLSGDKNEDSMVLLLQYGAFRMLFTGDLENEAETALASSGMNLSCDILKVGHHGSNGASSEEFLAAASPAFGIISCGANNRYGHPGVEAVERLLKAGITLYTTMECGALTVRSDGTAFSLEGFLNTTAYTKN